MGLPTNQRDYFAEMYVAGVFADHGWNVYFPRRDQGFDFIVTKEVSHGIVIRPVQVKGKYPEPGKTKKVTYGFRGTLTALHKDMVLAIPFFASTTRDGAPTMVAYTPHSQIRRMPKMYRCEPATFDGEARSRKLFAKYFDHAGLAALEHPGWR